MHPGRIAGSNVEYSEPDGWSRAAHGTPWPIHARRIPVGDGYHIESAWFPTVQEIHSLLNGGPVYLTVMNKHMPAVKLQVGQPSDKLNPLPRALNVTRSMLGNRAVTVLFETAPTDEQLALLKQHLSGAAK